MDIIKINNLTKDYGNKKGIFNVNISIKKGEVFGFLGPNGAGKTTTIRNLMGFIRPDSGTCSILGMDCFKESEKIKEKLGYLAGEIAFFDDLTGIKLLNFLADMKGIKDKRKMNELIERFELDPRGKVKKMSKGMKQKIGIISAFMSDAEVFILDEPTSGLDPLMQHRFVDLVLEEKKKGKTTIDKQFEYNTYIRDFFEDNQGRDLEEAITCWKYKKSLQGHNRYEKSDLVALG